MTKLKYYDDDVLTYVGGKKWAVEQRKEHRDGIRSEEHTSELQSR